MCIAYQRKEVFPQTRATNVSVLKTTIINAHKNIFAGVEAGVLRASTMKRAFSLHDYSDSDSDLQCKRPCKHIDDTEKSEKYIEEEEMSDTRSETKPENLITETG